MMNECCNNNITIKSFEYVYHLEKDNYLSEFKTEEEKARVRHNLGLTEGDSETERINSKLLDKYLETEILNSLVENNLQLNNKIVQKINDVIGENTISTIQSDIYTLNGDISNIFNHINESNSFFDKIKSDYYDSDLNPIAPTTPIPEQSSIDSEDLANIFLSGGSDDSSIIPVNVDIATDEDIDNFFTDL